MKRQHRKKELTEVQELRLENKKLKEEIRSLKKDLRRLQKSEHLLEESIIEQQAEQLVLFEDKQLYCPICSKGKLIERFVVGRCWYECDACEYDSRKHDKPKN